MNYVLIDKKQLDDRGLFPYAELLPDGRAILPLNALKSVTGLTGVDIVDSSAIKALQEVELPVSEDVINTTPGEVVNPPSEVEQTEETEQVISEEVINE